MAGRVLILVLLASLAAVLLVGAISYALDARAAAKKARALEEREEREREALSPKRREHLAEIEAWDEEFSHPLESLVQPEGRQPVRGTVPAYGLITDHRFSKADVTMRSLSGWERAYVYCDVCGRSAREHKKGVR